MVLSNRRVQVLVKEALVLSARLRLPNSIPFEEVYAGTHLYYTGPLLSGGMPRCGAMRSSMSAYRLGSPPSFDKSAFLLWTCPARPSFEGHTALSYRNTKAGLDPS